MLKSKVSLYKNLWQEYRIYLHEVADAGSRLLFKFQTGTHGLNEELGRHRGKEGNKNVSCGNECEGLSQVLWECLKYSSSRVDFLVELHEKLEDEFQRFDVLDSLEKSSFILGSELWEDHFDSLLALVKEHIVNIWETHKLKLYAHPSFSPLLEDVTGFEGHSNVVMSQAGESDTGEFQFSSYMYKCRFLCL